MCCDALIKIFKCKGEEISVQTVKGKGCIFKC